MVNTVFQNQAAELFTLLRHLALKPLILIKAKLFQESYSTYPKENPIFLGIACSISSELSADL